MAQAETQDLVSVGSRVSWGAILAGAFVALTLCIFLGLLGGALNFTAAGTDIRGDHLALGAGIWVLLTLLVALFLGGFVASRTTVGERKGEALMYGVLVWAVVIGMMTAIAAAGTSTTFGFTGFLRQAGMSMDQPGVQVLTAEQYRQVGLTVTPEQHAKLREQAAAAWRTTQHLSATSAAWWTFAGIGFSLLAAILGGLVGAGPELVLRYWGRRRVVVVTPPPH
jgi:hypothetical protein